MKSDSIKEITVALARAQIAFKSIKRTEKVGYDTRGGGSKQYNYAPLDVVIEATREALSANELAITQTTYIQGGGIILETMLSHSSGEWISGELFVGKQDIAPQALGSAFTYMRRYAYSAILNVASEEDDDASGAMGKALVSTTPPEKPKSSPSKVSAVILPPLLSPQLIYETAASCKTGGELTTFAMKHGYTKARIQAALGIEKSADIKDVKVAAMVLFPEPEPILDRTVKSEGNYLVEEAIKLGAKVEGKV